jgi:hypothetical protein
MRRVAVKPLFHSLLTRYWQLPPPTLATELDELAGGVELATEEGAVLLGVLLAGVLLAGLLLAGVLLVPPPTMPKGAGWALQVLAEIQLLLFSYPQPELVTAHSG